MASMKIGNRIVLTISRFIVFSCKMGFCLGKERGARQPHKRLLYCVNVNRTSLDHLLLGKNADVDMSVECADYNAGSGRCQNKEPPRSLFSSTLPLFHSFAFTHSHFSLLPSSTLPLFHSLTFTHFHFSLLPSSTLSLLHTFTSLFSPP